MTVDSMLPRVWTDGILDKMLRQVKPLFIAGSHEQAAFWANQWGFRRGQWRYAGRPEDVRGLRPPWNTKGGPQVFLCGTYWENETAREAIDYLQGLGFEIVMAEDIR